MTWLPESMPWAGAIPSDASGSARISERTGHAPARAQHQVSAARSLHQGFKPVLVRLPEINLGTVPAWQRRCSVAGNQYAYRAAAAVDACPYHQADWHVIAAEAVRIVRTMGESLRDWEVRQAAEASSLSEGDRRWLLSLLGSYPITWSGDYFSDGQRRLHVAAARGTGDRGPRLRAPRARVDLDDRGRRR